jgi:hypothetical protein
MSTAVLERPVRQKTWHRTQGFEETKPQVKINNTGSNIIHRNEEKKQRISSFKTALQETKIMSAHIAQNGVEGYKTLDDLLNED